LYCHNFAVLDNQKTKSHKTALCFLVIFELQFQINPSQIYSKDSSDLNCIGGAWLHEVETGGLLFHYS